MIEELMTRLPPRTLFPAGMPRYPNLWFLIDERIALRSEYGHALRFLERTLDDELSLRDDFNASVRNPNLFRVLSHPGEGADFQARIAPLEGPADAGVPEHEHQLHVRFYCSPLVREGRNRVTLSTGSAAKVCHVVPASLHYEVATEDPLHPYVDSCPLCGVTGSYEVPIDRSSQDYCLKIHDPLGIELLLHGTIRGAAARWADGREVRCLPEISEQYGIEIEEASPGPEGCARFACVYFGRGGPP